MKKKKVLIVVSKYDEIFANHLLKFAVDQLKTQSWIKKSIIEVPGSFEIPSIIEKYIKKFDGIVALGCIIKGETNNFDLISKSITDSLMNLSIKHKKPIGNGIITCFNEKQARERLNKGREAATAVQKILLLDSKDEPLNLD